MRYAIVGLPRARRLLAALIAVGVLGAVCASSGAAHTARAAASKSTWVIGNIGTYSGINSGNFLGAGQTLQAWADYTNAHGGVDGHKIKVISLDDAGVASTSVNDVKQLVATDHVLAIVGMSSGDDADWASYIEGTGVPVIGGSTPLPDFAGNPDYFPVGATANNSVPDLLLYAKNVLKQTVGGYLGCEEAPVCSALEPVYAGAYSAIGGKLAYNTLFSSSAPSYAAQCLAAQSAGVQDLEIIGPAPVIPKIAQNCQSQGYNPTLLLNDVVLTPSLASSIGTADAVFGADAFPFTSTGNAAAKTFHAALQEVRALGSEPGGLHPRRRRHVGVWAAVRGRGEGREARQPPDQQAARGRVVQAQEGHARRADPAADVQQGQAELDQLHLHHEHLPREHHRAAGPEAVLPRSRLASKSDTRCKPPARPRSG